MHVASTDPTVNELAMFVDNVRMTVRTGRGGSTGTQLCCMSTGYVFISFSSHFCFSSGPL